MVNYIPTYLLHKVAPAGNMGHRGLPLSLPSLFVTHADQSPYPLHRHPRNRHPFLLSPRLAFHPPMRKGAAPKRDPFRAGISLQFVTHPSLIRSGLLQAWPRTSWRHHSFPPHRRSYPRCRIGGIRLRQASQDCASRTAEQAREEVARPLTAREERLARHEHLVVLILHDLTPIGQGDRGCASAPRRSPYATTVKKGDGPSIVTHSAPI